MANKPSTILRLIGKALVVCGWDGADWQALKCDSDGNLQVDLVAGLSTVNVEGPDADGAAATGDPVQVGGVDGAGNVQAVLTDTTGRPLVAQPTAADLNMTEASAASILAAQTDGSQVAKVHGPDAPGGPPTQNPVYIAGINGGGNVEVVLVDNAGQVRVSQSSAAALQMTEASAAAILAKIIAAPATEAAQTTAAEAREWTRTSVTWTTDDGTAEVDMTLPSGEYQVMAVGHENAQGAGAVSYQIHGSTETGFTPGANRYEFYTSEAAIVLPNGAYEAFLAPVPITVTGDTVYFRIIPDVGGGNTTTGALDIYTRPNQ